MTVNTGIGQPNDPAATDTTSPWSLNSLIRELINSLGGGSAIPAAAAGNKAANITTKTTTLVKSGPGIFVGIQINKQGASDALTIYDSLTATGTIIGTISDTTKAPAYNYNYAFTTGLTIVSAGTTAGDYTVLYR